MSLRFLHAADIHLDSPLRGLDAEEGAPVEVIRGATRRALGNLVDLAIAEDVAFVLIAGDIYDGNWPDYRTGIFFVQQIARLLQGGRKVFAIRGNHDAENHMTRSLRLPDGVRLLDHKRPETVVLAELGIAIHGQSFAAAAVTDNLAHNYPAALAGLLNIGLLHTSFEDGGAVHSRYAPCSRADLVGKGYDYWALGHIHARQQWRDPWIVFPGNLQGRHINEPGEKGATLVTVAEGRVAAVEHRVLDAFRWARVSADLTGCESEEAALAEVAARLAEAKAAAGERGLAVRLTLTGATSLHGAAAGLHEKLAAEARALSEMLWIEGVEQRTRPLAGPALTERGDALGALARRIADLAEAPDASLLGDWPAQLRSRLLPAELAAEHAINDPEGVLARARDLLLARLGEG